MEGLNDSIEGTVLVPGDSGYDAARVCFNALIDRHPAGIVRCLSGSDVATALDFAKTQGVEVAVRGGGHNPAGHCICDDGMVIDLSLMNAVEVDPHGRTATAQGGSTWLDFDAATQAHGLVTPGGVVGSTGVTGLTFGGGIGHLTAQFGLTCDGLVSAEVMTPSGGVVTASEEEDSELLWGLRGGGGNFGIATQIQLRLHPLEHVFGGRLVIAGPGVRDALRAYRDICATNPRDMSFGAILDYDGDAPVLCLAPCYTGSEEEPEELRELRSADGVVEDGWGRRSFLDQQLVFDPTYGEDRAYWKGHFVKELPDDLIDALLDRMNALGESPGQILIESLHGAAKDAPADSAAVGFRDAAFNLTAMGTWTDSARDDEFIAWSRETAAAFEPWSLSGGYINYMQGDEPIERVRAAFGEKTFDRLQQLKGRCDPKNVLRRNQNVPPPVKTA